MTLLILGILVISAAMVHGPIAAFLVELFPARIRYTSMSLPYHIGNAWLMTSGIGTIFIRETKDRDIRHAIESYRSARQR